MAATVELVFNGPEDLIEIPGVQGDPTTGAIRRGATITVTPELAGGPSAWVSPVPPAILESPNELAFHELQHDADGNVTGAFVLGVGLLAQTFVDNDGKVQQRFSTVAAAKPTAKGE